MEAIEIVVFVLGCLGALWGAVNFLKRATQGHDRERFALFTMIWGVLLLGIVALMFGG